MAVRSKMASLDLAIANSERRVAWMSAGRSSSAPPPSARQSVYWRPELRSAPLSRQSAPCSSMQRFSLRAVFCSILLVFTAGTARLAYGQTALTSSASFAGTAGRAGAECDRPVTDRALPCREAPRATPSSRSCRSQFEGSDPPGASQDGRWSCTPVGERRPSRALNDTTSHRTDDRAGTRLSRVGCRCRRPPPLRVREGLRTRIPHFRPVLK